MSVTHTPRAASQFDDAPEPIELLRSNLSKAVQQARDLTQTTLDEFGVVSSLYPNGEYAWVDLESGRAFPCEYCWDYHWHDINVQHFPTKMGKTYIVVRPVTVWNYIHGKCVCGR